METTGRHGGDSRGVDRPRGNKKFSVDLQHGRPLDGTGVGSSNPVEGTQEGGTRKESAEESCDTSLRTTGKRQPSRHSRHRTSRVTGVVSRGPWTSVYHPPVTCLHLRRSTRSPVISRDTGDLRVGRQPVRLGPPRVRVLTVYL